MPHIVHHDPTYKKDVHKAQADGAPLWGGDRENTGSKLAPGAGGPTTVANPNPGSPKTKIKGD